MQKTLTPAQVREFDQAAETEFGVPGRVLMENAGRGVADYLLKASAKCVLILCGKGNNGGDGFVIARHLESHGVQVRVMAVGSIEQYSGDAAANYRCLELADVPLDVVTSNWLEDHEEFVRTQFRTADWIVDALLGIGVRGTPRPPMDRLIEFSNIASAKRLAVDIPSGLDAETGVAYSPAFQADVTCTMAAVKPGLLAESAKCLVGQVEVVDLGAPRKLLQRFGLLDKQ